MRMNRTMCWAWCFLAALAGCQSRPEWVDKGGAAFSAQEQGECFFAVGAARDDPDPAKQQERAEASARVALADQMRVYVTDMWMDFLRKHRDAWDPLGEGELQFVRNASLAAPQSMLASAAVMEFWRDPRTDVLYVLLVAPIRDALARAKPAIMRSARDSLPLIHHSNVFWHTVNAEIDNRTGGASGGPQPEKGADREK